MKLVDLTSYLDSAIPLSFQEDYDNSGLQVGLPDKNISSALLTLDVTEEVLDEAIAEGCDVIISHHPVIFQPVRRITGRSSTERILRKAILNDVAIYSAHTNLDVIQGGVSKKMAEKMKLRNIRVLVPLKGKLLKLVTFIPEASLDKVKDAIFLAGAGEIGNYDRCSFTIPGTGSYRGNESTNPYAGKKGTVHLEKEIRFETILYSHLKDKVIQALLEAHPYEEVAYDLYPLENMNADAGTGCTGELLLPLGKDDFLRYVSEVFDVRGIRYSGQIKGKIKKVALCGGAGGPLLKDAEASGADAYVTADIRYHSFLEAGDKILVVDIGHYESEKFSTEILSDLIIKKFPKFAVRFSEINTNPINYFQYGKNKNT